LATACSSGKRPTVEPIPSTTSSSVAPATTTTAAAPGPTSTVAGSANTVPVEVSNAYDAVSSHLWPIIRASMALVPGRHTQQPAASRAVGATNTYLIGIAAIPFPSFLAGQVAGATVPWQGIQSLFTQLSTAPPAGAAAESLIGELNAQVPPAMAAINTLRSAVHLPPLT
jgi:hypothetical protein